MEAAAKQNENDLRDIMKRKYSKLNDIKDESYGMKTYVEEMNIPDARMMMRVRGRMVKCKMNFSCDRANMASSWRCHSCMAGAARGGAVETQSHILFCPAYAALREGKSLSSDKDVVDYFRKVMEIREKLLIEC